MTANDLLQDLVLAAVQDAAQTGLYLILKAALKATGEAAESIAAMSMFMVVGILETSPLGNSESQPGGLFSFPHITLPQPTALPEFLNHLSPPPASHPASDRSGANHEGQAGANRPTGGAQNTAPHESTPQGGGSGLKHGHEPTRDVPDRSGGGGPIHMP